MEISILQGILSKCTQFFPDSFCKYSFCIFDISFLVCGISSPYLACNQLYQRSSQQIYNSGQNGFEELQVDDRNLNNVLDFISPPNNWQDQSFTKMACKLEVAE